MNSRGIVAFDCFTKEQVKEINKKIKKNIKKNEPLTWKDLIK